MTGLEHAQASFVQTINDGPCALNPELFAGDPQRILLGIKAHANTISYARLRALEDTFPRMRSQMMGGAAFNALSRAYCGTAKARGLDNNWIGSGFAAYLTAQNAAPEHTDMAHIEWATLESYHAADAPVITLADLATFTEQQLLTCPVICHPAARVIMLCAPDFALIEELERVLCMPAILITRPEMQVQMLAIDMVTAAIFEAVETGCVMADLLEIATERTEEGAALTPMLRLIGAGALAVSRPCG